MVHELEGFQVWLVVTTLFPALCASWAPFPLMLLDGSFSGLRQCSPMHVLISTRRTLCRPPGFSLCSHFLLQYSPANSSRLNIPASSVPSPPGSAWVPPLSSVPWKSSQGNKYTWNNHMDYLVLFLSLWDHCPSRLMSSIWKNCCYIYFVCILLFLFQIGGWKISMIPS